MPTIEERVAYLEGKVEEHSKAWQDLKDLIIHVDGLIIHMKQNFDQRFINFEQTFDHRFINLEDKFEKRFVNLEQRAYETNSRIDVINK